jgi:hypothetical protein
MSESLAVRPVNSRKAARLEALGKRTRGQKAAATGIIAGLCLSVILLAGYTHTAAQDSSAGQKGAGKMAHATGMFEVKLTPQPAGDATGGTTLTRMSLDKQFHGGLEGTSKGEMLATGSAQGSGGYVAIEIVSGTLAGRKGTFALQHSGTMTRGAPSLSITVVPDSGTGELAGLSGKMTITIADGKHSYDLEYTLGETP